MAPVILLTWMSVMTAMADLSGNTAERVTLDLCGAGWQLWLDRSASWEDDPIFVPAPELGRLPVSLPSGGWSALSSAGLAVEVPGTVEEYLWDTEGGDYKGVSWWWRELSVPASAAGRRVILQFEAVRLRAEVFIDERLAGYDAVGNTPFELDITAAVRPGHRHRLAVRITDPSGNFDWMDFTAQRWGPHFLPASHGFGGITGPVRVLLVAPVYVQDVFVRNTPVPTTIDLEVTVRNTTPQAVRGDLRVEIREGSGPDGPLVYEETWPGLSLDAGDSVDTRTVSVPQARLWSPDSPQLYTARVSLSSGDACPVRFGFRWFAPEGIGDDAIFRLNGRRIVLRSAISWGFWPINGITPPRELAEKQIRAAKELGLNMLNFHRCIGQPLLLDLADEMGLLYYQEPGGYTARGGDELCFALAREKLLRMVRRDRSHPSLVIYNMINEEENPPEARHRRDMADAHRMDPSRTITYTSGWARRPDDPIKLHMRPCDAEQHLQGWYDFHNAAGPGLYRDEFYRSPVDFTRFIDNKKEIVFWGEEGANATPPRLELIVEQLEGRRPGWDGTYYRAWYEAYRQYLRDKKLESFFPSIDNLTRSLGNIQFYYQGRIIENIRAGNITDGYAINGWEAEKIENHSGVVDCFRNFKGDPELLARYNAPLYVAVKLRRKVGSVPLRTTADFYLVNETDLRGPHELRVALRDASGKDLWSREFPVSIHGGEEYGQLLVEGVEIAADYPAGRYTVIAELHVVPAPGGKGGALRARGDDELFFVDWRSATLPANGAVYEQDGALQSFLRKEKDLELPAYSAESGPLGYLLIGQVDLDPQEVIPSSCLLPAEGIESGLTGEYYKGVDYHRLVFARTDPTVNFDWSAEGPARAVGTVEYSVRWRGRVRAPESGLYQFYTVSDDGVRLWIDGRLVVDHWSTHGPVRDSAPPLTLEAGREYDVRLEYFQRGAGAVIRLLWARPSMLVDGAAVARDIARRVRTDGTTVVVLKQADVWARLLAVEGLLSYQGRMNHGMYWLGGNFFARAHPLLADLPVNGALNWEYQELVHYGVERYGLFLEGEEAVVGSVSDHQQAVSTAVGVVSTGPGRVVLSTLDILGTLAGGPGPADVSRKLLCNYIRFAGDRP